MTLLLDRQDKVLRVTLNRPEVNNAFDGELIHALIDCFTHVATDPSVHVVVLSGAGKGFCAGADIKWMRSQGLVTEADNAADARRTASLFEVIDRCPKPIVGRIHGASRGGGVGLAACIDIPVGLWNATFALTEVRIGLAPAVISPYVIAKIGARWARELFLTAATIDARQALAIGLLNYVEADDGAANDRIDSLVSQLLLGGPNALAASKDLARTVPKLSPEAATDKTANLIASLRASAEGLEGMRAFITKEKASWTK